jgi:pimeloyl-ACP methyl ester carboxylesterase
VAVAYALTHPARVERLALLGSVVPGFTWHVTWRHRVVCTYGLGELVILCGCAPMYRAAIAACFYAPDTAEVEFLVRHDYRARTAAAARAAWLRTTRALRDELVARRPAYRRAINTLDLPVMLVHGRQDRAVSPAHCAEAAEGFPRGRVRWLDACGHFPHIEHPDLVNRWLQEFVVGRPAPR